MILSKEAANKISQLALDVMSSLHEIIIIAKDACDDELYSRIKKTAGISIGEIQVEILNEISKIYPELDNLK
jgi:hypothetical protein